MEKDFPQYTWSIHTLDRILCHFNFYFSNNDVEIDEVKETLAEVLEGPGKLLGYRAMHKNIRQIHNLDVPRDLVYAVMCELDLKGLDSHAVGAKKKKPKGYFTTKGSNFVHSVDRHDKL